MDFRSGSGVGAKGPTPVSVRLAPQCADLPAAGRTTSFRRLSLRRRLVCRAGQSSRTKNGRQSCPTRRERARPSKEPTSGKKPPPHQRNPGCRGKKSPGMARTNHPRCGVRTTPAASYEPPPLRRAVRGGSSAAPCDPPTPGSGGCGLATYIDWQIRYYRFLHVLGACCVGIHVRRGHKAVHHISGRPSSGPD